MVGWDGPIGDVVCWVKTRHDQRSAVVVFRSG
eukprot:COSAG01_NODE_33245_length_567_cov_1.658120_1_plen_31_part_10